MDPIDGTTQTEPPDLESVKIDRSQFGLDRYKSLSWDDKVPPPPIVVPHPLSFPRGGWGTVTWSTQKLSLRLIVLLCG